MKTINQPSVGTTSAENSTVRYLNQYRCPDCNKEIEPYESVLIEGESAETELPVEEPALANATQECVNRLFVVSYEIDYVHRVSVGITADSPESAQQIAEQAFNDASIWDDTAAMPLLSDEYHEAEGESLVWECVAVASFSISTEKNSAKRYFIELNLFFLFEYHGRQETMTGNDQITALESDKATGRKGSTASVRPSQQPAFTSGVIVSESIAEFESESLADFNRTGWLVWSGNLCH